MWFKRFYQGCRSRIGQDYHPNLVLTTLLIVKLLDRTLEELSLVRMKEEKFDLITFGSYLVISHVLSLQGSEGFMLNLGSIGSEMQVKRSHCVVALRGKVKGETIERNHIFPCCKITSSGINVEN